MPPAAACALPAPGLAAGSARAREPSSPVVGSPPSPTGPASLPAPAPRHRHPDLHTRIAGRGACARPHPHPTPYLQASPTPRHPTSLPLGVIEGSAACRAERRGRRPARGSLCRGVGGKQDNAGDPRRTVNLTGQTEKSRPSRGWGSSRDLLRRGHTRLFCSQPSILPGDSLEHKNSGALRDPKERLVLLLPSSVTKLGVGRLFMLGFLWE
nr:translation initiation factor IF-2-like [Pongo abelii]